MLYNNIHVPEYLESARVQSMVHARHHFLTNFTYQYELMKLTEFHSRSIQTGSHCILTKLSLCSLIVIISVARATFGIGSVLIASTQVRRVPLIEPI